LNFLRALASALWLLKHLTVITQNQRLERRWFGTEADIIVNAFQVLTFHVSRTKEDRHYAESIIASVVRKHFPCHRRAE
jgi:hypothetical protein